MQMDALVELNELGPLQLKKVAPPGALALPAESFSNGAEPKEIPAAVPAVTVTACGFPFEPLAAVVQVELVNPWNVSEKETPLGAAATESEASVKVVLAVPLVAPVATTA